VGRIEDQVRRALRAARARGGDVAEAAEERLAPAVAAIDGALAPLTPAREAEAVAWAAVLAEDTTSDTGIKSLRDAMWNALGRLRHSPFMVGHYSRHRWPEGATPKLLKSQVKRAKVLECGVVDVEDDVPVGRRAVRTSRLVARRSPRGTAGEERWAI
jgi:hypothetical protein